MLGRVAQSICCTLRGQFSVGNEFENGVRNCLAVAWLDEKAIVSVLYNLRNIANVCGNNRTPAREGLTQHDRGGFCAQGSNHYHVARCVNVRRIPAIARHDDLFGQSGAIDCIPHVDPALQYSGALSYDDKARVWTLLQYDTCRLH